jgi:hypothetical protein
MPTIGDVIAKLLRDFELAEYWAAKFRRYRIEPGAWRAMANRLAKIHDKKYGRPPHRRSKPLPPSIVAEIDRLKSERGMNTYHACYHLHKKHEAGLTVGQLRKKADTLRKAYDRLKKRLGQQMQ